MISVKNISKHYGNNIVLKDISYEFQDKIYGLVGRNGAGKSTFIGILTGLISPDKIDDNHGVFVENKRIDKLGKSYRSMIGYMPQVNGIIGKMTVFAFLMYIAELKEIPRKEQKVIVNEMLANVNMQKHIDKRISELSGGMKQRVMLAQALIGNPSILYLDEPTVGLDPAERENFKNIISSLAKGKTIIICTHIMEDLENLASQILVLKDGNLLNLDFSKNISEVI